MKLSDLAERVLCEIYDNLLSKKDNAICSYELGVSSEMFVETWRELSGENEDGVTYVQGKMKENYDVDDLCASMEEYSICDAGKEYVEIIHNRGKAFMIESSRKVYNYLQDDLSKEIFLRRCAYSLSGDINALLPMLKYNSDSQSLYKLGLGEKDYIFGCGYYGNMLMNTIRHSWRGFIDNNSELWGKEINNIPVFNPGDVDKDARIFIANRYHHSAIYAQLKKMGFDDGQLVDVGNIIEQMASKQYFDLQAMPHNTEEVFADIGALNGDTSKLFIKWCRGKYEHIYCFEPDERNIAKCKVNLATELDNGKVTLIPKGAWNKTGKISFVQQANGTSMIGDGGEAFIDTITMDEALIGKNVTFIKMDIEGAEYSALQAAEKIITKDKPKLAISVYHCPEDIIRIPELILGYNPEYRLYLRHYSPFENETILYAI